VRGDCNSLKSAYDLLGAFLRISHAVNINNFLKGKKMKKCLITLFILAWPISAWAIEEREGYCKILYTPYESQVLFTVPEGKNFVLLQLINRAHDPLDYKLQVDGNDIILGRNLMGTGHDFPDRCVIVNSGETLTVIGPAYEVTIIGYFYNCPKRVSRPVADLTNDRKVDFSGFAVLASEWLKDGNINSGA